MEFIKKDIKNTIIPKIDKIIESNGSNKPVLVLLDYIKNTVDDCTREDIIKLAFLNNSFIKVYSKKDIETEKTIKTNKKRKRKDQWKNKELEILKSNILIKTTNEIHKLLPNRSLPAIRKKAWELGFSLKKRRKKFKKSYDKKNVNKCIQKPIVLEDKPRITIIGIDDKKPPEPESNKVSEKDKFKDFNDDFLALKQYILDWSEKNNTDIIDIELMEKNRLTNAKIYSINSIFKGLKTLEEDGLSKQIAKNKFILYKGKINNSGG